jgi:hypothetical protein
MRTMKCILGGAVMVFLLTVEVGTGEEPWMRDAIAESERPVSGPGLYPVGDVWARGQQVTLVVVRAATAADELRAHLAEVVAVR